MAYNKYKDDTPEQTIERIREIYQKKLGLEMDLKVNKRVDGIYSATLTDTSAMWNTCGKGTSDLFASASAFGESVEHLCIFFAYEIANLSDEANKACGFEKYPDEVMKDLSEMQTEFPDMILDLRQAYGLFDEKKTSDDELIKLWKKLLHREEVPFVPYYSVRTGQYKFVPENMIFYLCGSNGGGAGNTPEEAIGHACDEIMERYVKYNIYMQGLTPPIVPREYINERCPELIEVINALEQNDGYEILVKDASMGKGYSVMSVLMINRKTSEYLVNFGAHPRFEIALERCLTEMLQAFIPGKHNYRKNMEKWNEEVQERAMYPQNWVTILKDDSGVVPDTYFMDMPSWEFAPWPQYNKYNNRLGMQKQLKQLLSIAPDVYVRDSSYLGFPAYRVYVPTVSTSHIPVDEFQLRCYEVMEQFPQIVDNRDFTKENIELIEKTIFSEKTFVNGLIFRSLGEAKFHLLHAAACFDIGDYTNAKKYLRLSKSEYSECLIRTVDLIEKGYEKKKVKGLINLFFENELTELAEKWQLGKAFEGTIELFESMGMSFSPRLYMKKKNIDATNKLHIALKKVMLEDCRGEAIDKLFADITL